MPVHSSVFLSQFFLRCCLTFSDNHRCINRNFQSFPQFSRYDFRLVIATLSLFFSMKWYWNQHVYLPHSNKIAELFCHFPSIYFSIHSFILIFKIIDRAAYRSFVQPKTSPLFIMNHSSLTVETEFPFLRMNWLSTLFT